METTVPQNPNDEVTATVEVAGICSLQGGGVDPASHQASKEGTDSLIWGVQMPWGQILLE